MRAPLFHFAPLWLALWLPALTAPAASSPFALLHSIFNPGTNGQAGAQQGYSVALDGNIAVVGVPYADVGGTDSGVVKVYEATSGALLHTLTNRSPAAIEYFGFSVTVSGTRVVVGAPYDNTGASGAGSAYVYELAGDTPTVPVITLTNPSPAVGDHFGLSVAISGSRVVVGAYQDNTGAPDAGSAYVYDLTGATPTAPALTLTNPSPAGADYFGYSVAILGTRVVVGAYLDDTGATNAGSAYVYDLTGGTPAAPALTLTNPNPAFGNLFATSLAISGPRVVVGAFRDDTGAADAGRAYVYDLASATPTIPLLTLTNPSPAAYDYFGYFVAISGMEVAVGVPFDDSAAIDAGSVCLYDLASATPEVPVLTLTNPSPAVDDRFGGSVAISGLRLVVGAFYDNPGVEDAGSAYLYDLSAAIPALPVAALKSPVPALDDNFGWSVAISGTRLVVGTRNDDTGATNAGIAYLYDLASSTPLKPMLTFTNPAPAADDSFGWSVAISGAWVIIGAHQDGAGTLNVGSVYVYDLGIATPTVPVITLTNPSPPGGDLFGWSVAASGNRVAVGAIGDNTGNEDAGSTYIFDLANATPTVPVLTLTNPTPEYRDYFGWSVAISGTRVLVGTVLDDTGASDAGSAYVYDLASGTPAVPALTLTNPSPETFDLFGDAVAISGARVVVGAPNDGSWSPGAGSGYVYDLASARPAVPVLWLINPAPAAGDQFGRTVAISGTRVVVGAYQDDAGATNAGSAYVYDLASAHTGAPMLTLTNPSPATNDWFGRPVAIDGTTIVVGAPYDDTLAQDRGAIYIFGVPRPTLQITASPGFATLSWTPTNSPGFVLQQTDSLAPTNWVSAPSGASNPVTVPITNGARFYRVAQP